jgi:hypothetical protein
MNMRGRPALKTYLLARQVELFPSADHTAYLEKRYPYLAAMRALVDNGSSAAEVRAAGARLAVGLPVFPPALIGGERSTVAQGGVRAETI